MAVTFVAAGTGAGAIATATPGMPAGATTDDLLILVIEGEGEDTNADSPPTGGAWNTVGSVASATGGAADATRCSVYWAWYDAAINRVVPDAGNHTIARIYAFRGVDTTTPIDATSTSGSALNATSHSAVTGLTSVTDGAMAVLALTHGDDVTIGSTTNANLVSVSNGGTFVSTSGSDGSVSLLYGIRTTAGAVGTFTWTSAATEERAWWAMVLRPAAGPQTVTIGQASETDAAQAITVIAPKTISVGQTTETNAAQVVTPSVATPLSLPFTDSWTGSDNDAWDSEKWPTITGEGSSSYTVDIDTNHGYFTAGTALDDFTAMNAASVTSVQDSAGTITISPVSGTHNQWLYVCLRSTGEQTAANAGRPATAFYFRLKLATNSTSDDLLYRRLSNTETTLVTGLDGTYASRNAGEPFKFKWEIEDNGSDVDFRWKMWDADASEPASWETYTDTAPGALLGASGILQLIGRNYSAGSTMSGWVDDLTYDSLGGAQNVAVGQATETDAAQAVTVIAPKTVAFGQATETDTPQNILPIKPITTAIGQTTETDTAQAITADKPQFVAVGQSTEADSADTVTPVKPITTAFGQATEADTAQAVTPLKAILVAVGQSTETDTAQAVTAVKPQTVAVGQSTETDAAQAVAPIKPISASIAQASETDSAGVITPTYVITGVLGQATESDTAQAITSLKPQFVAVGQSTETDVAQPISAGNDQTVLVSQATESDTAQSLTAVKPIIAAVGQSSETDTAQSLTAVKPQSIAVGQASETDVAQPILAGNEQTVLFGQATETDAAQIVTVVKPVSVAVGQATEADTAFAVTAQQPATVAVGQATETDTAQAIGHARAVPVGQATETEFAQALSAIKPIIVTMFYATESDEALGFDFILVSIPAPYDANKLSVFGRLYRLPSSNRILFVSSLGRGAQVGVKDWDVVSPLMRVNTDEIENARRYTEYVGEANKTESTAVIYAAVEAAVSGIYPAE